MTGAHERKPLDKFTLALMVAASALAVLVVLLSVQNRSLKQQLAQAQDQPRMPAGADPIEAGDDLASLHLLDGAGSEREIAFKGNRNGTLLLVFSSHCPACADTLPEWTAFARDIGDDGPRVVGVRLDPHDPDDPQALVVESLGFEVFEPGPSASELVRRVPLIPATIVIDPDGIVLAAEYGVLDATAVEAMVARLAEA